MTLEDMGGLHTLPPTDRDGQVYPVSEDGETSVVAAGRTAYPDSGQAWLASPVIAVAVHPQDDTLYAIGK